MWSFTKVDNAFSYLPTLSTDLDNGFCLVIAFDSTEPEPFQLIALDPESDDFEFRNYENADALLSSVFFRALGRPLDEEDINKLYGDAPPAAERNERDEYRGEPLIALSSPCFDDELRAGEAHPDHGGPQ